jgi:hypothetical protein
VISDWEGRRESESPVVRSLRAAARVKKGSRWWRVRVSHFLAALFHWDWD